MLTHLRTGQQALLVEEVQVRVSKDGQIQILTNLHRLIALIQCRHCKEWTPADVDLCEHCEGVLI